MPDPQTGQLYALLSALSFSFGSVFISKGAKTRKDKGVLFSVFVTMLFSFVIWYVMEAGETQIDNSEQWLSGVFWFVMAGVFAMVFGRTLLYTSIRHLGVTRAGSVKRLNPFFAVICAYIFLSEPISGMDTLGMGAIGVAFGLLIYESRKRAQTVHEGEILSPTYYLWGVGSALAYALANICRKNGLIDFNAPAFGTFISASSGFVFFMIAAIFSTVYRENLRNLFSNINRWLFLSGIFVSAGQIFLFSALYHEKISTVVMINSLEIFIASFLSVVVFRAEVRPELTTYIAAIFATIGVILVATY
jgi:uncharacterized membrane protein